MPTSFCTYSSYPDGHKLGLLPIWSLWVPTSTVLWQQTLPSVILRSTSSYLRPWPPPPAILRPQAHTSTILSPRNSYFCHNQAHKHFLLPSWGPQALTSAIIRPISSSCRDFETHKLLFLISWGPQIHTSTMLMPKGPTSSSWGLLDPIPQAPDHMVSSSTDMNFLYIL